MILLTELTDDPVAAETWRREFTDLLQNYPKLQFQITQQELYFRSSLYQPPVQFTEFIN